MATWSSVTANHRNKGLWVGRGYILNKVQLGPSLSELLQFSVRAVVVMIGCL